MFRLSVRKCEPELSGCGLEPVALVWDQLNKILTNIICERLTLQLGYV